MSEAMQAHQDAANAAVGDQAAIGTAVPFMLPCRHRTDERPAAPHHLGVCNRAATLADVRRPVPCNAGMCAHCQGSPAGWNDIAASLAVSIRSFGRAPGEESGGLKDLVPGPKHRVTPGRPIRWRVAVMVPPERPGADYLPETVRSLFDAGFDDLRIYAEPGANLRGLEIFPTDSLRIVQWADLHGCWGNHRATLGSLHTARANAEVDAFLLSEDDVLYPKGFRQWFEDVAAWPAGRIGPINGFLSSRDSHYPAGMHTYKGWGALCTIWRRDVLESYLGHKRAAQHQHKPVHHMERHADQSFEAWANETQRSLWCIAGPGGSSMVRHLGDVTSVWPGTGNRFNAGWRKELCWVGHIMDGTEPIRPCPPKPQRLYWPDRDAAAAGMIGEIVRTAHAGRLAACQGCGNFRGDDAKGIARQCRCPKQEDTVTEAAILADSELELTCPLDFWPKVPGTVAG